MCDRGLEGVVAKRDRDPHRPGKRQRQEKNVATLRFEVCESVARRVARRSPLRGEPPSARDGADVGYLLSGGLAKSGSRHREDPDTI
jgi:hypothetical protein